MKKLNIILEYVFLAVCLMLVVNGTMMAIPFAILYVGVKHDQER